MSSSRKGNFDDLQRPPRDGAARESRTPGFLAKQGSPPFVGGRRPDDTAAIPETLATDNRTVLERIIQQLQLDQIATPIRDQSNSHFYGTTEPEGQPGERYPPPNLPIEYHSDPVDPHFHDTPVDKSDIAPEAISIITPLPPAVIRELESNLVSEHNIQDEGLDNARRGKLSHIDLVINTPPSENQELIFDATPNPARSIEQALEAKDINALAGLLNTRFDIVSQGHYSWLRQLDDMGYTKEEMADLLMEQAGDSPWIFFEPIQPDPISPQIGAHLLGCVHSLFQTDDDSIQQEAPPIRSIQSQDISVTLQQLCGLAGIAPISRDLDTWNGSVRFEKKNSEVNVSYSAKSLDAVANTKLVIRRAISALEGLCCAFGHAQTAGLCCDSFTVLRKPEMTWMSGIRSLFQGKLAVEMYRIDVKLAWRLMNELKTIEAYRIITVDDMLNAKERITDVLRPLLIEEIKIIRPTDPAGFFSYCSLAAQFLSLAFLSYCQAHVGAILGMNGEAQ